MELNDLSRLTEEQDAGHSFELRDPVRGEPTGIRLTITGPDSKRHVDAYGAMQRANARDRSRGRETTPQERKRMMDDFFFAITLGWDIKEDGEDVPFTRENFQRLIEAGTWVFAQIDSFAIDRSPYFKADD